MRGAPRCASCSGHLWPEIRPVNAAALLSLSKDVLGLLSDLICTCAATVKLLPMLDMKRSSSPKCAQCPQVEDLFSKYGRIVEIDLKLPPRPPGFAFVEFAHSRDAQDAVDGRDGYDFYGSRLRVPDGTSLQLPASAHVGAASCNGVQQCAATCS